MEQQSSRMAEIVALSKKRLEEHNAKVEKTKERLQSWIDKEYGRGEISEENLDLIARLVVRRENLVGLMAKATPFSERYNEISKEIVDCELEIVQIDNRFI